MRDVYNTSRQDNKLPKGFNEGIVTLIYKKGSRTDVRNYRPITLLNGDYKVLTRILAKRMLDLVSQCVSPEQIGFMPRTFIAESSMLINLLKAHLESVDEGGLMTFLDLEKAFDKVSWDYMKRSFKALRFQASARSWIDILYDDSNKPKRRILINGELSDPYYIARGTAQGCPLSPCAFLIVVEGLTRLVEDNPNIEGITIGDHEFKIRHFADDTFGILKNDTSYNEFNKEANTFFKASAMSENFTKRDNIAIGSESRRDRRTLPGGPDCWVKDGDYLTTLGVPFGNNLNEELFWLSKIKKAKKALANARFINQLNLSGRSKLVNANYYGTLRYYLWTLDFPCPTKKQAKADKKAAEASGITYKPDLTTTVTSDVDRFLWRRDPELDPDQQGSLGKHLGIWMARKSLSYPFKKGGAGLINWTNHVTALQAQWIIKLIHPRQADWMKIIDHWLGGVEFRKDLFLNNSNSDWQRILKSIPKQAAYFRECVKSFRKLGLKQELNISDLKHVETLQAQPIFRNFICNLRLKRATETRWRKAGYTCWLHLIARDHSRMLTPRELAEEMYSNDSNIPKSRWKREATKILGSVPAAHTQALLTNRKDYSNKELIRFQDDLNETVFGRVIKDNNTEMIQELNVDDSGFYTEIGSPHDTHNWDNSDWALTDRAAIWHDSSHYPIRGIESTSYPQDQGWTMCKTEEVLRLSQCSISKATTALQLKHSKPPNCERIWNEKVGITLPWRAIWKMLGTFLTNPRDEEAYFKLLHRKLNTRTKDSRSTTKMCRMKCGCLETQLHLV